MKILITLICCFVLSGCLISPQRMENNSSRKFHPEISELDNLEMLLLNEQEPVFRQDSSLAPPESIRIGMNKRRVKRALGLPNYREVAGNPKYENERWIYERSVPTLDGYYKEKRIIYFEKGRLVGWESR